jgi:hypothetical protein
MLVENIKKVELNHLRRVRLKSKLKILVTNLEVEEVDNIIRTTKELKKEQVLS